MQDHMERDCVICQMELMDDYLLASLACNTLHLFHLSCLKRWSDINNTCPYCRSKFTEYIIKPSSDLSRVLGRRTVKPPTTLDNHHNHDQEEESNEMYGPCQVCNEDSDEHVLLLCDGCDDAYHTYCLQPRLESVPGPDIPWICPVCTNLYQQEPTDSNGSNSNTSSSSRRIENVPQLRSNRLIRNHANKPPEPTMNNEQDLARVRRIVRRRRLVKQPISDETGRQESSNSHLDIYKIVSKHSRKRENVKDLIKSIERSQKKHRKASAEKEEEKKNKDDDDDDKLWKMFEEAKKLSK